DAVTCALARWLTTTSYTPEIEPLDVETPTSDESLDVADSTLSESGDERFSAALWSDESFPARVPSSVFCFSRASFLVLSALNGCRSWAMTASRIWLKSMLLKPLSVIV